MAARSKAWVCGCSPAEIVVLNPAGVMVVFSCECRVLSSRGLCDELITRPEESYRLCRVVVWSRKLKNEEAMARVGPQRHSKNSFVGCNMKSRAVTQHDCNVHVYEVSYV